MDTSKQDSQPVRMSEPAVSMWGVGVLASDADALASVEPRFGDLVDRNGLPPLWRRTASFDTLVRFILEQQVSLASAQAAHDRLSLRLGAVSPEGVLASSDEELRSDGFSRQKAGYVRGIAESIEAGVLDPTAIADDRNGGVDTLLSVRGIGPWTAACFALFVSGDRDSWPTGDRALYVSIANVFDCDAVPTKDAADALAGTWAPYRATAARLLWHDYLGGRDHTPNPRAGFIDGTGRVPA